MFVLAEEEATILRSLKHSGDDIMPRAFPNGRAALRELLPSADYTYTTSMASPASLQSSRSALP